MKILGFIFEKTFRGIIGCIPEVILFVLFTDETTSFLDKVIIMVPFISHYVILLTGSSIILGFVVFFVVHELFVKKYTYAFYLASSQIITQSILVAVLVFTIVPFRYEAIPFTNQIFYLISGVTICILISSVIIFEDYSRKEPKYLTSLEALLVRHPQKPEEKEARFIRFEGFLWTDFENRLVADRSETREIINLLKNKRFCFLAGHQASGKSIILRSVGYELVLKRYLVFIENAERLDVDRALLDIKHWNLPNVVVMVDDVHRNPKACSDFLERADKLSIKVIFSARPLNTIMFREGEGVKLLEEYEKRIEAYVSRELISEMIQKYCRSLGFAIKVKKEDVDSVIEKCGTDLWLVAYLLSSWNPKEISLREVTKENIYEKVYDTRIEHWLKLGKKMLKVMQLVSALYKYEIPFFEKYLDKLDLSTPALELANEGYLIKIGRHYYLHHPSVAMIYLEALAFYGFIENHIQYSSKVLSSYLTESGDDQASVLYKISTLPSALRKQERVIIERLIAQIDRRAIISQIEKEKEIERIGSFFRSVSQIDAKFANEVLAEIDQDHLRAKFSRELMPRKQKNFISDISLIDKEYADEIWHSKNSIVAVVPLHNEETVIPYILPGLYDFVDSVLVVDDGSKDSTAERAKEFGAKVARHEVTKGIAKAILTGIKTAEREEADMILVHVFPGCAPSEISKFIKPIVYDEADLVVGFLQEAKRYSNLLAINKKGINSFLKYLDQEKYLDQINRLGLGVTRILFKKILRVVEVPITPRLPREIYRIYRTLSHRRGYYQMAPFVEYISP